MTGVKSMIGPLDILVVDDHADSATALARLLRREGHRVTTAHTVAEALAAAGSRFDVLLGDVGLPDGNGCDLLRALRERGHAPRLAVALTGHGEEHWEAECRQAGFTGLLLKPVQFSTLREFLAQPNGATPVPSALPHGCRASPGAGELLA